MENLRSDIRRYAELEKNTGKVKMYFNLIFTQAIWAIVTYRFGAWCFKLKIPFISSILKLIYFFLNKFVEITTGISISSTAKIGKGLYIGHFGGIFINSDAVIGQNCTIAQGVTIGTLGLGKTGAPKIGNYVFMGSGAKVLGDITIGNRVKVGANAVVVKNVPDNATVVGIPAQIVKIAENTAEGVYK